MGNCYFGGNMHCAVSVTSVSQPLDIVTICCRGDSLNKNFLKKNNVWKYIEVKKIYVKILLKYHSCAHRCMNVCVHPVVDKYKLISYFL